MGILKGVLVFVAGAVAGSLVTSHVVKAKYEELIEEEVQSVKDMCDRKIARMKNQPAKDEEQAEEEEEEVEEDEEVEKKSSKIAYNKIIKHCGYVVEDEEEDDEETTGYPEDCTGVAYRSMAANGFISEEDMEHNPLKEPEDEPYVIDPEEFGEIPEFATETLTYYADGILTDDCDDPVDDPEYLVGDNHVRLFQDFDVRVVYIRNDKWQTDFEIIKDDWFYSDIQAAEEARYEKSTGRKMPPQDPNVDAKVIQVKKPHQL